MPRFNLKNNSSNISLFSSSDAIPCAKRFLTQELFDYESGAGGIDDIISALTCHVFADFSRLSGLFGETSNDNRRKDNI